jgi:MFS family permease
MPARARRSLFDPLAPLLAILTEAAWISVVAAMLQALAAERVVLGPIGLSVFAATGLLAARYGGDRLGGRWPRTAVLLTFGAAALGWLLSPTVMHALTASDFGRAFGDNPGGWCAGLALLRGMAHARPIRSAEVLARAVAIGIPVLAVTILIGGAVGEPWRSWFVADAILGVIVFLGAGTLGIAIARMSSMATVEGFDWRRNRAWMTLVIVLVPLVAILAIPASSVLGPAIQIALGLMFLPMLTIAFFAGLGTTSYRTLAIILVGGVLLILVLAISPAALQPVTGPENEVIGGPPIEHQEVVATAVISGAIILATVVILVLVRLWMRQVPKSAEDDVAEERMIDRGGREQERPTRRSGRRRRRVDPTTAPAAYLALIEDLGTDSPVARGDGETPAEHARRLRQENVGNLRLDLLAADYQLGVFGARPLAATEHRRAIARWRRLRRSMLRAPRAGPD